MGEWFLGEREGYLRSLFLSEFGLPHFLLTWQEVV